MQNKPCTSGYVRNPRTSRCVRADLPLGQTIVAATRALRAGQTAPPCPGGRQYDFSKQTCVGGNLAAALREVKRQWDLQARQRPSNAEAALAAKGLTSAIFNDIRARNTKQTLAAKNKAMGNMQAEARNLLTYSQGAVAACQQRLRRTEHQLALALERERQLRESVLSQYNGKARPTGPKPWPMPPGPRRN